MATRMAAMSAVLFDLDGVLTDTAGVHRAAWKQAFDAVLSELPSDVGGNRAAFTDADYALYVDGRRRLDGVRAFLASRNIELPDGADSASAPLTVNSVGTRKNELFQAQLAAGGAEVFPGSLALVRCVRERGKHTAVVSASSNCSEVLRAAGIEDLFDVQVDGLIAARDGLRGKPFPDTYLAAARELDVQPADATVIEDAISGVQAGRDGGFGLVVGVDRVGNKCLLFENGADLVIADLGELLDDAGCGATPR